jgi:hypothetical protein
MLQEAKEACTTTTRRLIGEGALLVDVREPREVQAEADMERPRGSPQDLAPFTGVCRGNEHGPTGVMPESCGTQ